MENLTYKQIKEKYKETHGNNIRSCWIADAKRKNGYSIRIAYNRIDNDKIKYFCPNKQIEDRIIDILKND